MGKKKSNASQINISPQDRIFNSHISYLFKVVVVKFKTKKVLILIFIITI